MKYLNLESLRMGDLIVRKKGPLSTHYMVYLYTINGVAWVAENQIGYGVRIVTLNEGLGGQPIVRFEPFGGQEHERQNVLNKIKTLLGTAYDLIAFNCEHFARLIAEGKVESKQVKTASSLALTGGLGLLAVGASKNNKGLLWFGGVMALAGAIGHFAQRNN